MVRKLIVAVMAACFMSGLCYAEDQGRAVGRQARQFRAEERKEKRAFSSEQKQEMQKQRAQMRTQGAEFRKSLKDMTPEQRKEAISTHNKKMMDERKAFIEERKKNKDLFKKEERSERQATLQSIKEELPRPKEKK